MFARWAKRLWRRAGRVAGGCLISLLHIATFAVVLLVLSGYVRGDLDDTISGWLGGLKASVRDALSSGWLHDDKVDLAVGFTGYLGFALLLLLLCELVRRIPSFVGGLVLAEFDRRRGHRLSSVEQLISLSLIFALAISLFSHGMLSLLGWIHSVVAFSLVKLLSSPTAMHTALQWYARMRLPIASPEIEEEHEEVHDEEHTH